jgi:DNA-binding LacI/PurR family transcriptional regulator
LNLEEAEASIHATLEKMLQLPERVTGIFTTFDSLSERIYLTLVRMGVRVPEDISIIGIGGMVRLGAMQQMLTAVTVDERQVGRQAAEFLQRMRLGELPLDSAETRVIPAGFSEGRTLATASQG